jgi:hypothetical protein
LADKILSPFECYQYVTDYALHLRQIERENLNLPFYKKQLIHKEKEKEKNPKVKRRKKRFKRFLILEITHLGIHFLNKKI